jgi:hypothetical protein
MTDEEYQSRIATEQERDLARRCGFNAFEASHYTPAQMQAALQRPQAQHAPESFAGRWIVFSGNIWNAHADICPAHLQAEFAVEKKYFLGE